MGKNLFSLYKSYAKSIFVISLLWLFSLVGINYVNALAINFSELSTINNEITLEPFNKDYKEILASLEKAAPSPTPTPQIVNVDVKPAGYCLKVPVILYHHIEPIEDAKAAGHVQLTVDVNNFEMHMKYLVDNGYKTISAEELVNALLTHQPLSEKSIVVTLDDGYRDAYLYAFPIAKKYNVVINLAIPTGLLENQGYLSWNELKEMTNSGIVFAYNHTWSHYALTGGERNKIEQEVQFGKKALEEHLKKEQSILFYPYGSFNERAINVLQSNNIKGAYTTIPSFWQCEGDLLTLHRNHIGNAPLSSYNL